MKSLAQGRTLEYSKREQNIPWGSTMPTWHYGCPIWYRRWQPAGSRLAPALGKWPAGSGLGPGLGEEQQ